MMTSPSKPVQLGSLRYKHQNTGAPNGTPPRVRDEIYKFIQVWTEWDPRQRINMETRHRLKLYDLTLNFLIFTPLIILHNQAANGMLEFMFLERFPVLGAWFLLVFGVTIEFLLCFCHRWLLRTIPLEQEIYPIMASHAFIYLLTFGNICHIRAIGDLYGIYIGEDWYSAVKATMTGLAALFGLKSVKSLLAPPLTLTIDSHKQEEVFDTPTLFSTEADLSVESALDSLATVGVVHSFVHLTWSGWWSFLDTWLFPDSPAISSLFSMLFGYAGCLVVIFSHSLARKLSQNLQNDENDFPRLVFEDVYHIVAGLSSITVWRGFWNGFYVLGSYFPILYKGKDVTCLATHVISFALLALANVSTSLMGKGVDIDGRERDGRGISCDVDYFCEYFRDELEEEEQTKVKRPGTKYKPVAMVTGNPIVNGTSKTRPVSMGDKQTNNDLKPEECKTPKIRTKKME